jgi:hypothetical protein
MRARAIPPRNVRELAGVLVEEWGNISQQELANLVHHLTARTGKSDATSHSKNWQI